MTARHRKLRREHPLIWLGLALAVLIAFQVMVVVLRYAWPVLLVAGAGFVVYRVRRRRGNLVSSRPRLLQGQVVSDDLEAGRLRAENDQLRADLADAQASARAAWDAASSVPPRPAPAHPAARDRLLADRLGGVHDLFRSDR